MSIAKKINIFTISLALLCIISNIFSVFSSFSSLNSSKNLDSLYLTANQLLRLLLRMKIVKNGKSAIAADMSSTINCSIVLKPCRAINTMITARTTG